MTVVVKDRVKVTSTSVGTGSFTLGAAATGFQNFANIGNGNQTYYTITNGTDWEVGVGTYSSAGPSLSRDEVLSSSNSNNLVDWGAGSKDVFVTYPAETAAFFGQSIPTYAYEDRNDLRTLTPEPDEQAVVDDLGLFIFQLGSTALDDDETCFATSNGRWLLQGASFDLVEAWTMPRESLQEQEVLYGSAFSSITSVASNNAVFFNITVLGAKVGASVAISPPRPPGPPTSVTTGYFTTSAGGGRLSIYGTVITPDIVTIAICNPSANASLALTNSYPFVVAVINPK